MIAYVFPGILNLFAIYSVWISEKNKIMIHNFNPVFFVLSARKEIKIKVLSNIC